MNLKEYQEEAARTMATGHSMYKVHPPLIHCAIGISTEAGELLSTLKKSMFYGTPIDHDNIREELGDLMWYIQNMCNSQGWDLEEILEDNIKKLKVRYPEKFTEYHATARLDKNDQT